MLVIRCLLFFFLRQADIPLPDHSRRQKADQIYQLGIARRAAPLDRLKKRYQSFTSRMLVAPPLPTPPPEAPTPSSSTSSDAARTILGAGAKSLSKTPTTAGGRENGGRLFNVFSDGDAAEAGTATEGQWEDLGTVKSRQRENVEEAVSWTGETMPMKGGGPVVKPLGLEVFRDEVSFELVSFLFKGPH